MSTILMRTDLLADARVLRIVAKTKASKQHVVGALYWLWATAQTQSTDGLIACLNAEMIDEQTAIPGFADAVASVGWLVIQDDSVVIPEFEAYFGKSAKTRHQERLKKARQRWEKPPAGDKKGTRSGRNRDTNGTEPGQDRDKTGTPSGQRRDTSEQRIGSDWIGSERIGSERSASEPPAAIALTNTSAGRFLADRAVRTGNAPPGFVRFMDAYPPHRATARDKALIAWEGKHCEEQADAVCDGLAAWNACDEWATDGVIPNAEKFIAEGRWAVKPPPPKSKPQALGGAW